MWKHYDERIGATDGQSPQTDCVRPFCCGTFAARAQGRRDRDCAEAGKKMLCSGNATATHSLVRQSLADAGWVLRPSGPESSRDGSLHRPLRDAP
jgi:hypothetical protein